MTNIVRNSRITLSRFTRKKAQCIVFPARVKCFQKGKALTMYTLTENDRELARAVSANQLDEFIKYSRVMTVF